MSTSALFNCHESGPHRVLIQCTLWPGPHSTFSGTRTPKKMEHYYGWKIWWSESWKGKLQMIHCELKQSAALNDMFMNPLALFNWDALETPIQDSTTVIQVCQAPPHWHLHECQQAQKASTWQMFSITFSWTCLPFPSPRTVWPMHSGTPLSGVLRPIILPCLFREIVQSTSYPYAHFTCPKTGNLRNNIQWGIMLSFYGILVQTCIRRRLVHVCLHSEFHLMWFHDGAHPWICAPSSEVSSREHPFCFFLTSELISFVILSANTYPVKPKDSPRHDT